MFASKQIFLNTRNSVYKLHPLNNKRFIKKKKVDPVSVVHI